MEEINREIGLTQVLHGDTAVMGPEVKTSDDYAVAPEKQPGGPGEKV
jgi:hypothetical protein